jgi:acyl-coenzyme A synthetase/AMP-(fatty) acid ligase
MEDFCVLVEEHGIESGYLVPPIIPGLAKSPVVDGHDLSSLDYITSGAAPLGEEVAHACADRLGCLVKQGHALPNTEFRIVDVETHDDVKPGERGEIWVRGRR